jgi:ribose transport system ATP-binding protein
MDPMPAGTVSPARHSRLEITRLSKTFGRTRVLDGVHLAIEAGEIHALVGANGSGKSTLIKVIAGYHAPDRGAEMSIDGRPVSLPVKPGGLNSAGISVVHQDLGLIDHLSVAENISIGQEERTPISRRLNRSREADRAREILAGLNIFIDVSRPVQGLAPEERASVAIARAMRSQIAGRGLIVLDESTRALSAEAALPFYRTLRHAVRDGGSVLLVAHALPEVIAAADRVSVIRDGKMVAEGLPTSGLSEQAIARMMVGREVEEIRVFNHPSDERFAIEIEDLAASPGCRLAFGIRKGEIVGVTGKTGAGWERLPYLLAGGMRAASGRLRIDGRVIDLTKANVRPLLSSGVVLVPERREAQGVAATLSIAENVTLPRLRSRGRFWFSGVRWQRREAKTVIDDFGVRPGDPKMPVGKLSGGNQQKVLFGKWLLSAPKLLILHEPTQGVDVAARLDLLHSVLSAAEAGASVLLVTNDVNDLSALCRRVLVIHDDGTKEELIEPEPDDIVDAVYEGLAARGGAA